MEPKEFGEYLKSVRKEKGLTIRQVEAYSGVSNAYLSQLENGKRGIPSPEIIKKIHKPLGIDYNELMSKAGYLEVDSTIEGNKPSRAFNKFDDLTDKERDFLEKQLEIFRDLEKNK